MQPGHIPAPGAKQRTLRLPGFSSRLGSEDTCSENLSQGSPPPPTYQVLTGLVGTNQGDTQCHGS